VFFSRDILVTRNAAPLPLADLGGFYMPAPVYDLQRGFFDYLSDDTTHYVKATTLGNAAAQTSPPPVISPKSLPAFPRGWSPRKVYGTVIVSSVVYRTHIPIFDPADIIWVGSATTFTKGGATFTIEGAIGEKRTYKGG
jgi:hypothetical protein